jgi:hypothetical protein
MWLFIGLPLVALCVMLGIYGSKSLDDIKDNWIEHRCNPIYIPFANYVRPDVSTAENFQYCMGQMSNEIFKPILDAMNQMFADINLNLKEAVGPLDTFREMLTRIRKFMMTFASTTFGKITNSTSAFTFVLIKIRDLLGRFVGQGYVATYFLNTAFSFVVSFIFLCITVIKIFVYSLLVISIILAFFKPWLLVMAVTLASLIAASGF